MLVYLQLITTMQGGLSQQGKRIASSIEKGFSGFNVIEKLDNARFRIDVTTQIV